MILKIQLCLVLSVAWISKGACTSVSKVYFQSGAEALPLEYYQYGTPGVAYSSSQLAQLSAAPVNSVVPANSGYVSPCVPPCVYPGQTFASYAPAPSSGNLVSYQPPVPNLPIVTSNLNEPVGYEYEYVVYDQTGDKKSQNELNDGSIIRGKYSFFQPSALIDELEPETNYKFSHENHIENDHKHPHDSHGEGSKNGEEKMQEGSHKNVLYESRQNIPSNVKVVLNTSTKEGQETKISTERKSTGTLDDASVLVPYKDIIKCIESLLSKTTMVQTESPLAYIVLNKPC